MKRFAAVALALSLVATTLDARVLMKITKNYLEKAEVDVLLLQEKNPYGEAFLTAFGRDLGYSGNFSLVSSRFAAAQERESIKPTLAGELLVIGEPSGNDITFTVEDMIDHEILFKKTYTPPANARSFAHKVNDDIVLALTGKPGIAATRIAYIAKKNDSGQLYVADYDGMDETRLTAVSHLISYPRWMPGNRALLLVSYQSGWPKLVRFDPATKTTRVVSDEPGINACASVCATTGEIALVLSKSGDPEIYLLSADGKSSRRLTYSRGIESSPSFSPDDKTIAFVSDRAGSPQIYLMNRDGYQIRRISYNASYATSPAWSPDGSLIAYVVRAGGSFGIAVYELATRKITLVGDRLGAEDIAWAPDNRHLVYTCIDTIPNHVAVMDIYTREVRRLLPAGHETFSPSWTN